MPETWSTAQAALIVEQPLHLFQKLLDNAPVKPRVVQKDGRRARAFELADLIFFRAFEDLKRDLTPEKQTAVHDALRKVARPDTVLHVETGYLTYDFNPYLKLVLSKIAAIRKLIDLIDTSGEEPLIKGTKIEAYRVAALCEGTATDAILQDYPSLNKQQILAAKVYAQSHPKVGRPFPKTTAKAAMRQVRIPDVDTLLPSRE